MKNIAILVPETAVIEAVADPRYAFTAVNEFLKSSGEMPLFHVQLVGLTPEVRVTEGIFSIRVDAVLATAKRPDLIIIPAISGDLQQALRLNAAFLPWIVEHYNAGAEVASLCLGAFLLAESGLLKGKTCSTHWLFANEFRSRYPDVELLDNIRAVGQIPIGTCCCT
jgi:transcriptional regulator GlxA family with amidase domain